MTKMMMMAGGALLAVLATPTLAAPGHGRGHDRDRDNRYGYNNRACPPGLAKRNNGCQAPGQARRLSRGQRYASNYGYRSYSYNTIPYNVRRQYNLNRNYRYYYNDGYLYGVDPTTQVVQQVIQSLLR